MQYLERIQNARPNMSKSFHRLADFIIDSYISTALMTATELAHEVNIDAATVVRFAQSLGYSGFPELHKEIKARVKKEFTVRRPESSESSSTELFIKDFGEYLVNIFSKTDQFIDVSIFTEFVDVLSEAKQIKLVIDPSWNSLLEYLESILVSSGKRVEIVPAVHQKLAQTVLNGNDKDTYIFVDVIRDDSIFAKTINELSRKKVKTCAIAGAPSFGVMETAGTALSLPGNITDKKKPLVVFSILQILAEALAERFSTEILDRQAELAKIQDSIFSNE